MKEWSLLQVGYWLPQPTGPRTQIVGFEGPDTIMLVVLGPQSPIFWVLGPFGLVPVQSSDGGGAAFQAYLLQC